MAAEAAPTGFGLRARTALEIILFHRLNLAFFSALCKDCRLKNTAYLSTSHQQGESDVRIYRCHRCKKGQQLL